jgi:DNA-binding XRE family transcriptional regulator
MDLDRRSVLDVAAVVGEWTADDVRALRKALRLSQRAFAAPLAVSQRTVVSWEAGAAISDEFAIRLDDLLRRAEVDVQRRFRALRSQSDPWVQGVASVESWTDVDGGDWTVHLWVLADDAEEAHRVAREIRDGVTGHLSVVEALTTFAPVGQDRLRRFVGCEDGQECVCRACIRTDVDPVARRSRRGLGAEGWRDG